MERQVQRENISRSLGPGHPKFIDIVISGVPDAAAARTSAANFAFIFPSIIHAEAQSGLEGA